MRIAWTRRYLKELAAIADYIGERNPQAAARVVGEIHGKTKRLLSTNPFIGRVGEIKGTRELVIPAPPRAIAFRIRAGFSLVPLLPRAAWEKVAEGRMRALSCNTL